CASSPRRCSSPRSSCCCNSPRPGPLPRSRCRCASTCYRLPWRRFRRCCPHFSSPRRSSRSGPIVRRWSARSARYARSGSFSGSSASPSTGFSSPAPHWCSPVSRWSRSGDAPLLSRSASRPSEEQIEAAVAVCRVPVANIQRPDRRIGAEETARRFERTRERAGNERRTVLPGLERKPSVDALEQLLLEELVVIKEASEGQVVGDDCTGWIARLLEETSPGEQVVTRQWIAAELAPCFQTHLERVSAERPG